ncbi:DUF7601 domain-containing protein [Faecalibacterium duncaniae]
MKKRWFVVILTIGLLLHVLPLSVLALSPDPTITDSDGTILDWSDLSTVPYSLDDSQEQEPPVPDLSETGSEKSLASNEATADDRSAGNLTPKTPDEESGGEESDDEESDDKESDDKESGDEESDDKESDDKESDDEESDDKESDDDDSADDDDSTTTPAVCKIDKIDDTYYYSTLDDAITAATDGDQIDLLKDIEWYTGLEFHSKKNLTISGGNTYTLTLEENGIYASDSDITFEDLTLKIHAHTHTYEHGAGQTANLITHSSKLRLSHVEFELTEDQSFGSGIFLEHDSDLYFEDNTNAVIRGFDATDASGIYAESYSNNDHGIWVTSSSLEITGCDWNGMTIDPINLTLDNAKVTLTGNGLSGYYAGGLGCYGVGSYGGTLTMRSSTLIASENVGGTDGFGAYVGVLDMDAASTVIASNNSGSGLCIGNSRGDESHIYGQIYCEGNGQAGWPGGGGFVVHTQHTKDTDGTPIIYEGNVTIEPGACIYARNNKALAGVLNNWILNIESGATVIADNNEQFGLGNSFDARTTIKSGANVSANNNLYGIYNYAGGGDLSVATGFFLIEGGAHVTANNNRSCGIFNTVYDNFDTPADDYFTIQGSADVSADGNGVYGIYNDGGIFTIENGANISTCNNSYDGIFNANRGTFTMETGANVSVCNNSRYGIYNTNSGTSFTVEENVDLQVEHNKNSGIVNNENATLTLLSGRVRYNTTSTWYGGGLRNYSTATLSDDVQLYNNHAEKGGDDIENGGTITFGPTGRGWELDGDPDCYDFITGWYDDYETTRWNAHGDEADLHIVLVAPVNSYTGPLSLKAAHGSIGSLTVCKETLGELLPSDYDTAFTFELTLDDDTITTIDDKWCGVPFKNGKASFTLKSGESITLSNLPAGIGYTITETAQDGWTLLNLNPAETGVVPQNDTAKVVFTNLKNSPDDPYVPVVPVDPETPEIPEEPEGPETPEIPEEPEEPEIPEETEETEETEAPGELPAEEPAQTDTSASLAQPEETPTQNTTTVTLIQTGTTDWLAAVLLIFGIGLLVCGWFFDRKQRAAKH